jgi:hypothetical protein
MLDAVAISTHAIWNRRNYLGVFAVALLLPETWGVVFKYSREHLQHFACWQTLRHLSTASPNPYNVVFRVFGFTLIK